MNPLELILWAVAVLVVAIVLSLLVLLTWAVIVGLRETRRTNSRHVYRGRKRQ